MPKFQVYGTIEYNFQKTITAESEEEVIAIFDRGEEEVEGWDMTVPVDDPEIHRVDEIEEAKTEAC